MTPSDRPLLLVVDDEPGITALVDRFARGEGFDVIVRQSGREALAELSVRRADAALVDLRMPDVDGLQVLRAVRAANPACQVVLMTAHATVESAIDAIKLGALDYLSKPFDLDRLRELLLTVRKGLERRQTMLAAHGQLASQLEFCGMIGRSPVMQELFDIIRRLAPYARTALVTGETGTGKELVARALHRLGARAEKRFVTLNCSAVVETLVESELFGHTRGAFTGAAEAKPGLFELADGGTLFLDEIGELPVATQAKFLRVVEYGEVQRVGATSPGRVDVHVVAATNRVLSEDVAAGRFRRDLYYRLNVVEIHLPPLGERREDIPYLTAVFLKEFATRFRKPLVGVSPGAERLLQNAPWPGNIRELRHTLERACILSDGRILSERELRAAFEDRGLVPVRPVPGPAASGGHTDEVPRLNREGVERALRQVAGNRAAAARLLGVSRRALYRRLDTFGLR